MADKRVINAIASITSLFRTSGSPTSFAYWEEELNRALIGYETIAGKPHNFLVYENAFKASNGLARYSDVV